VNVAVVNRKLMPDSETGYRGSVFDDTQFEVQEATLVPKKAGLSILMFDLCCAKGRQKARPKKAVTNGSALPSNGPEYIDPTQWDKKLQIRGWDPQKDYHLTRETESLSLHSTPHQRSRKDEPLRLQQLHCRRNRNVGVEDPLVDQMREREVQQSGMREAGWQQRGTSRQERHEGHRLGSVATSERAQGNGGVQRGAQSSPMSRSISQPSGDGWT